MLSAFLETADGWKLTEDPDTVLNHEGDLLLSEDQDDQDTNLAAIGARTGQFATAYGDQVILTDSKLHWNDSDAQAEVFATGSALVFHTGFRSSLPHVYEDEERDTSWDGVVGQTEGRFFRLRLDQAKWKKLTEIREKKWRHKHRASLVRQPCKDDFEEAEGNLAKESGGVRKEIRLDHLCLWILAHDSVLGKRAVNRLVRDLALRWCNDRKKSRKWLGQWASEAIMGTIDKRLAAVCRLGDRNSRHRAA